MHHDDGTRPTAECHGHTADAELDEHHEQHSGVGGRDFPAAGSSVGKCRFAAIARGSPDSTGDGRTPVAVSVRQVDDVLTRDAKVALLCGMREKLDVWYAKTIAGSPDDVDVRAADKPEFLAPEAERAR